jgi:outer membrane protein assembly factor BamA/autotransporter translocation and assembly factor TamB
VLAGLIGALHLPEIQQRLGRWAMSRALPYGVDVRAEAFSYNLFTLHFRLDGLSAASTTDPSHPFLQAERLEAWLPRSVLRGRLAVSRLVGDGLRIDITRRADGSTNLPATPERSAAGGSSSFPVDQIALSNLAVAWRDDQHDIDVVVDRASMNLSRSSTAGARGTLAWARPIALRVGDRTTNVSGEARLAWDGAALQIESMRLTAPEAGLNLSGSIGVLAEAKALALNVSGEADLAQVSAAWLSPGPRLSGRVAFTGRASGTVQDPRGQLTIGATDLLVSGAPPIQATSAAQIDRTGVDLTSVALRLSGGTVNGRGRISFVDTPELARGTLEWRDVDLGLLLGALSPQAKADLNARLDGRASLSASSWRMDGLALSLTMSTRSVSGDQRPLALNGTATAGLAAGRWHSALDQRLNDAVHVEGHGDGYLNVSTPDQSTVSASLDATTDSWTAVWETARTVGTVTAPPVSLSGGGRAQLSLAGPLSNPDVTGSIEASLSDLSELQTLGPSSLGLQGRLDLSGQVSGTMRNPAVMGQLSGHSMTAAGQHADRLEATFAADARRLRLDSLSLKEGDAALTGSGDYDFETGAIAAMFAAARLPIQPVPGSSPGEVAIPISARLSGEWTVSGPRTSPNVSGRADLEDTEFSGRAIGRVSSQLTLSDGRLQATTELLDLFTRATASVDLAAPGPFAVDAQTTGADLMAVASRLRLQPPVALAGAASFATHAEGRRDDLSHTRVTVDLQQLNGTVGALAVQTIDSGRLTYDGNSVDVGSLSLKVGKSDLRISGRLSPAAGDTLNATLDGDLGDYHDLLATLMKDETASRLRVDGPVHVDAQARGSLDRPTLSARATLDGGTVTLDTDRTGSVALQTSYDGGLLTISKLDIAWQGATASATGDLPIRLIAPSLPEWLTAGSTATAGRLRARLDSLTPAVLGPFVSADALSQATGLVSGTLTLDASSLSLSSIRGQLELDRAGFTIAGVPFEQQQPTRIDVAGGRATISAWQWGGAGNQIALSGGLRFDGDSMLDVSADGTVDLRIAGAFLPGTSTGGRATLAARASGSLSDPQVDGHIDLERAEWRMPSPRLAVSEVNGRVTLSRDELVVEGLTGQANGGFVSVAGLLKHAGLAFTSGKLAISGQGLAMAIPDDLKTQANVELTLAVDRGAWALSGDAVVLGGAYREPLSLTSGVLQAIQAAPAADQTESPEAARSLALDVRLTTGDDIIVNNNYAQLALAADVRIGGTPAQPTLLGRAELRDGGRIFLGGNVYQLDGPGVIDFSNPSRIEPDLRIKAVTRVAGYQITLNLNGTPQTLQPDLTSETDPSLTKGEIASILVTGQANSAGDVSVDSDQLIAYLSGEVLGVTGRALGLDTLRVERGQDVRFDAGLIATETDPSSRLTFGKQVTRSIDLVFSQDLKDSGRFTWIVGYRPRSNVELRFVSQDNESRIYDFRHDVTIGGRAAKPQAVHPVGRIASVRFTGTPGVSEQTLRDELTQTEGKDFDFFRWQQDRDKLERLLARDEHFEARVSARRSEASSGSGAPVDLSYDLYRGPHTLIDVVGAPVSSALRSDLERRWSEAVFDGFLPDEAKSAVRTAMVGDGYVQATTDAALQPSADGREKRLVVRIDPGPRFSRMRVSFSGNERMASRTLEDQVARSNPSPWIDAAPLVRSVTTFYRDAGFLDAHVTAQAPVFEGSTTTLPVHVEEGPLFRVGMVLFTGTIRRSADMARKAFSLQPGAAMTKTAMDAAVEALSSAYRADGFNAVRVTLMSDTAPDSGLVALTVAVDEGVRQVLLEVTTEGAKRTNPELVSRELKLVPGQPVDRAAWAQARKRLYDTSVFRQVDIQAVPVEKPANPPADATAPADQPVTARVTLDEWPPLRVRYGLELEDLQQPASEGRDLRPGVAADITYRNPFGRAATTGLALRFTKDFEAARAIFSSPSFLGWPLTSNVFIARSRERFGQSTTLPFTTDKLEFTAEQRFRAGRRLQVAYSYNFQRNHTFETNADPNDPEAFDISVNIGRLTTTALVDTRDDLVDATRGAFFTSTFEYAGGLGSDLRFSKFFAQQNYYRSLGRGLVFATSGRLGLGDAYGQELILSERYYAGGGNSVRGYTDEGIGPRDAFGDPAGGNALVVVNEELRFPVAWRFRGVAFFDAGNAFSTIHDFSPRKLRTGAGVGLRVQTPFALLRVDLGTPLGANPGESRVQWFFSLGQAF